MTQSYTTWPIHVWHDSFTYDMTYLYAWYALSMYVAWLIHALEMTHWYVWNTYIYIYIYICIYIYIYIYRVLLLKLRASLGCKTKTPLLRCPCPFLSISLSLSLSLSLLLFLALCLSLTLFLSRAFSLSLSLSLSLIFTSRACFLTVSLSGFLGFYGLPNIDAFFELCKCSLSLSHSWRIEVSPDESRKRQEH